MKPIPKFSLQDIFDHYGLRIVGGDRGGWRKAQCPLPDHDDQNPSASVNTEDGRWFCHACAEGGDGLDIIQRRENVGLVAALTIAEGLADSEGGEVRAERGSSSLLPHRPGAGSRGGNWTPPWLRG